MSGDGAVLLQKRQIPAEELRALAAAGRLYAVLDACDTPSVPEKYAELGPERAACLYLGSAAENYWAFAPYLFAVDEALLDWIAETLWTEPFGIFAVADAPLEEMRRHFRRFLLVQSPDGEQWYFRFYDPRVLPPFLDASDAAEIDELYGPLQAFGIRATPPAAVELIARRHVGERTSKIRIRVHTPR